MSNLFIATEPERVALKPSSLRSVHAHVSFKFSGSNTETAEHTDPDSLGATATTEF